MEEPKVLFLEKDVVAPLKSGAIVCIGGIYFKKAEGEIMRGDLYIGERNTGPQFLTLCHWKFTPDGERDYALPKEKYGYPFDYCECVKVEEYAGEDK